MRTWVYNKVCGMGDIVPDPIPQANILSNSAYETGIEPPFIIISSPDDQNRLGLARTKFFDIYVHESQQYGYKEVIDKVIDVLTAQLPTLAPERTVAGLWVHTCEWLGNSGDLVDPDKGTAMRYASFRMTGRLLGA